MEGEQMAPHKSRGELERERRDDRPEYIPGAAQKEDHKALHRYVHIEHGGRVDVARPVGIEAPSQPGRNSAEEPGAGLVEGRVDAGAGGTILIGTDSPAGITETRAAEEPDGAGADQ